jgi:PHD/YefM family antitoxin component YafN of YafNO toxin-antitoxin module
MKVSITKFNDNISFYISKSKTEPIELMKRGIVVAVIISKKQYESQNQTGLRKTA